MKKLYKHRLQEKKRKLEDDDDDDDDDDEEQKKLLFQKVIKGRVPVYLMMMTKMIK